jgi:hypothetical protein
MALARREFTVTDEHGNLITDAQVEVRQEIAGAPLAVIYSDRDGLTPLGNPFSVDPDTAVAAFHAAGGAYKVRAFKTGFERVERYVGIGLGSETDSGFLPTSNGLAWLFDSSTSASDPGSGKFRLNNATASSATALYIDNENAGANSVTGWLDSLDDAGNSSNRGHLIIVDPDQPTEVFRVYAVSGSVVDSTGYRTITISHMTGAGSFTADATYAFTFSSKGPDGDVTGPNGGVSDSEIALFNGTSGAAIKGSGKALSDLASSTIDLIISIGGNTISTGIVKGVDVYCDFAFTIVQWTLLGDASGSLVIDIWKDTLANFPPTVADTITASAKPTISAATKGQSSTLTGWTTSVSAGDVLRFNVDSVSSIVAATLILKVTKTS